MVNLLLLLGLSGGIPILMLLMNRMIYPRPGLCIMEYLNNTIKSVRIKEIIGEGEARVVDVKFGPFWPIGKKYYNAVPKVPSRCLSKQGGQFYILTSPEPGLFYFVEYVKGEKTFRSMPSDVYAWALDRIKRQSAQDYITGNSFWEKNAMTIGFSIVILIAIISSVIWMREVVNIGCVARESGGGITGAISGIIQG